MMVKTEVNQKYELVLIIDAKLSNEEKEAILKEAIESVKKGGGKVINSQTWLDKHKLTFQIKKRTEGTYYLISFEDAGSSIEKIKQPLRLNEKILRFSIMKSETVKPAKDAVKKS
ncbi:MAG: 30S ribosomal protein S6 [Candidatus Omnitrophica bacterium]|nr:30S ribosomal protein S6 [Candidatus Omnitrophota bacterium]MCB9747606.1 30S ribosomal protein S6 [Candidatus Omnitrophota bacterium]